MKVEGAVNKLEAPFPTAARHGAWGSLCATNVSMCLGDVPLNLDLISIADIYDFVNIALISLILPTYVSQVAAARPC